jgi:hypothetical protein
MGPFLTLDIIPSFNINIPAVWRVFTLCLLTTIIGVAISLWVFPPGEDLDWARTGALGLIIAFGMMLLNYGAKYSNSATRDSFTPVDLLEYTLAGFFWAATWPALADLIGAVKIERGEDAEAILRIIGVA